MPQADISFKTTNRDFDLIQKISERAMALGLQGEIRRKPRTRMDVHMDIVVCHANGNPLNLEKLLNADDFNFAHDVCGIRDCLDRETGELRNFFSPRCSLPERARAQTDDQSTTA